MIGLLPQLMSAGRQPRFHGNGFTQLPLGSIRRLHVWHPSLPPIEGHNATIHNHVWDMQSRVLLGCLTHRTYSIEQEPHPESRATHDIYMLGEERPDISQGYAEIRLSGEYHMAAGSVYIFSQGEWHESDADGLTATLMEKRPVTEFRATSLLAGGHRPLVACPRGEEPVDAFAQEHQPTPEAMWRAIEDVIYNLDRAAYREIEASVA